jgi:hypothetical protein
MAIKEKKKKEMQGEFDMVKRLLEKSGARRCFLTGLHVEASCDNPLHPSAG